MGIFRRSLMALVAMLGFGQSVGKAINTGSVGIVDPLPLDNYQPRTGSNSGKGGRKFTTKKGNAATLKRSSIKRRNKEKNKRGSK